MLQVTQSAEQHFQELLASNPAAAAIAVRLLAPSNPQERWRMALDKHKPGDAVIQSRDGVPLLLLDKPAADSLSSMVVDWQNVDGKGTFTVSPAAGAAAAS